MMLASLRDAATHQPVLNASEFATMGILIVWSSAGPLFGYSEKWRNVVNMGTALATLLMGVMVYRG